MRYLCFLALFYSFVLNASESAFQSGESSNMHTALITGANRGIGLELAKQYARDNWKIIACCRNPEKAQELQALAKAYPSIHIEALDVSDNGNIAALAAKLEGTPIDLLLNNAGIYSGGTEKVTGEADDQAQEFGQIDSEAWENVLRVNVIAPIKVIEAFVPHLKKGMGKTIINLTSRMGSMTLMQRGMIAYRSSKAALNGAMRVIVHDLRDLGLTIVNLHPGWVITDMGGKSADLTVEKSVSSMRQVISNLKPEDSGRFLNYDGQTIPW